MIRAAHPPNWSRWLWTTALFGLVFLAAAPAAHAQVPTPENTVITNTATVGFTDANGNTYTDVTASVQVTVGFLVGIDVTAGDAAVTPASPSGSNRLTFTIDNVGNGTDQVSAGVVISDNTVVTDVSFEIGGTPYADIGLLNTALASTDIVAGGTLDVDVLYDVAGQKGGVSSTVTFTATSVRENTEDGSDATVVTPPITGTIEVTPDDGAVDRLPSNGNNYTATFSVSNDQTGADDLDLVASVDNGNVTIIDVNSEAGTSATVAFASLESKNIVVTYSVADVPAGGITNLTLTATSVANPGTDDTGVFEITVIRPSISMTKQAWDEDLNGQISGDVFPGQEIQYRIDVTNGGSADATDISVEDVLPAQVTYVSHSDDLGTPAWSISESSGTVTATLTTLGVGVTRTFWIRVQIK